MIYITFWCVKHSLLRFKNTLGPHVPTQIPTAVYLPWKNKRLEFYVLVQRTSTYNPKHVHLQFKELPLAFQGTSTQPHGCWYCFTGMLCCLTFEGVFLLVVVVLAPPVDAVLLTMLRFPVSR